jgi:predicted DsbA family dithiol-disulfide isomerase
VSDIATLEEAASELGIEGAGEYLRSEEGKREVMTEAREGSRMGISGVPFFICTR